MTKSSILALIVSLGLATTAHAATPTVTAVDAIAAVQQQSSGTIVEVDLRDQNGSPVFHVQALKQGGKVDYLVDGRTGKVSPMLGAQASLTTDAAEAGEGPNDADSGNEDAN